MKPFWKNVLSLLKDALLGFLENVFKLFRK